MTTNCSNIDTIHIVFRFDLQLGWQQTSIFLLKVEISHNEKRNNWKQPLVKFLSFHLYLGTSPLSNGAYNFLSKIKVSNASIER